MSSVTITEVRSEALFVSPLQRSVQPSGAQVEEAIRQAVRRFGSRGCAERVAQEFGDHPETAVPRMRWARDAVERTFTPARGRADTGRRSHTVALAA